MNLEIEKYLNGEMPEEEQQQFEARLLNDTELAEQTAEAKILLRHLKDQMLREKINLIVTMPPATRSSTTIKKWMWLAAGLAALIISLVLWLSKPAPTNYVETETTPVPKEAPQQPEPKNALPQIQTNPQWVPPDEEATEETKKFAYQAPAKEPTLRGNATNNADWDLLLDSVWKITFDELPASYGSSFASTVELLRDKKFPDAYVRLQMKSNEFTTNDTLHFLKGYCLLELKEGEEALLDFDRVSDGTDWQQQIEWYRVLAHLIQGDLKGVQEEGETILNQPNHPFRNDAKRILELLK